ncbi:MAG: hypothetical protein V7752_04275 [Halopseudomonas sp.]
MDWNTYALYGAIALLTSTAALFAYHDTRTTKPRLILTLIGALSILLTLSTGLYFNTPHASSNLEGFDPSIEVPTITDQNKAQIKYQAQTDLIQLLAPLRAHYDKHHPGDYIGFKEYKEGHWFKKSDDKIDYYIALLTTNPKAVYDDPELHSLLQGFTQVSLLAKLMEQELLHNDNREDVHIMTMQIEALL